MNFQKLLSKPEGKTLEFKRDLTSLKPILKTLVAFANTAGGTIIIGRSGGKITGVGDVLREEERLASVIADSIPPSLMPELEVCYYVSKVRNRAIVRVFRELGLMEEWGSGYRRVLAACQDIGYPHPDWQELGSAFRVTFYPLSESNVPINVPVNKRQQWFLNQIGEGKRVKSADLAHHWNVTEKTAKRDLANLKNQGMIEFVGSPKTGAYHLKE